MRRLVHVAPRALGILAIVYISLFALDVLEPGAPWPRVLAALGIHLVPTALLLVILIIAWRAELIGGMLFVIVSFAPFAFLANPIWVNLLLAAPFTLTGALFIAGYWMGRRSPPQ